MGHGGERGESARMLARRPSPGKAEAVDLVESPIRWTLKNPHLMMRRVSHESLGRRVSASMLYGDVTLSAEKKKQLEQLLFEFSEVFTLDGEALGQTDHVEYAIDTGNSAPIRQFLHRVPFALRTKMREMVDYMLERDVV